MKNSHATWWFPPGPWVLTGGLVLIAIGLLFRSHYRFALVAGDSMFPTLKSGELLLVDERAYDHVEPRRGDIVVARYSGGLVVKRIVGLPGEEVEVRGGMLYINGGLVKESHPVDPGDLSVGKGWLLDGDFATLGDNRAVASALAVHPIVTKAEILGKVVLAVGKQAT
jgi:signal peptidase I